ncbi:ATPase (AAA+ superfamily)-like protein [Sulfolobus islandicus REY15A]|uniref:ATPase (AAA+ superfamily)-like protein n=1 Tax=Saccharolobus islandicus (strain REY15A) TaxID=930945 RepID=F0NDW7_SACI5|nr:ATPase (AAA+ superfamily)-like protein [Sulfolobus islandicus REY15A]
MSNLIYENKVRDDVFNPSLDDQMAPELSDVIVGNAPQIYLDPKEFFSVTYITDSMRILVNEITNALSQGKGITITIYSLFGGGKTHTLLLLYHTFNNPKLVKEYGLNVLEGVKVIGIGGKDSRTAPSPVNPLKEDNVEIKTLWGYIAKKLGKYEIVRKLDEDMIAPQKDDLENLFKGEKVLILLDEIAYYLLRLKYRYKEYYEQCLLFLEALASMGVNLPVVLVATIPAKITTSSNKQDIIEYIESEYEPEVIKALAKRLERSGKAFRAPIETSTDLANVLIKRIFKEVNETVKSNVVGKYQKLTDQYKDYVNVAIAQDVVRTYPFHPLYIETLKKLLEGNTHLQGTREGIKITRYVIRDLWNSKPTRSLILPSDLSIKNPQIHDLLLKDFKNYGTVADTIIQRSKGLEIVFLLANYIFITTYYHQLGLDAGQLASALPDDKEIITSVLDPEYLNLIGRLPSDVKEILGSISSNSKNVDMIIPYIMNDKGRYWVTYFLDPKTICEKDASKVPQAEVEDRLDNIMLELAETPIDNVQKKGKKTISGLLLKLYRTILRNKNELVNVDEPSYYVVILSKPLCQDCKDVNEIFKASEEVARRILYYVPSGKTEGLRRYSNTITLLFSSTGSNRDKIEDYMRKHISCSNIDVTPYYNDKISREYAGKILREYLNSLENAIYNQIFQYFDKVAYPIGNNEVRIVELKSGEKTLLQQVESTLIDEGKIYREENFDFDVLVTLLSNLGIDITKKSFSVKDLREIFYTNPSLPFVTDSAIYNAIRNGVEKLEIGVMTKGKVYYKKYESMGEIVVDESSIILPANEAADKEINELVSQEKTIEEDDKVIKRYYVLELPDGTRVPLRELKEDENWFVKFNAGEIKLVEETLETGIELYAEPKEIEGLPGEIKEVKIMVKKVGNFNSKVYLNSSYGELDVKEGIPDFQTTLKITLNQDGITIVSARYDNKEKRVEIVTRLRQSECEKVVDQVNRDSRISEIDIIDMSDIKTVIMKLNSSVIGKKGLAGEINVEDPNKKISVSVRPSGSNILDFINFINPILSLLGLKPKISGSLRIKVEEIKGINKVEEINELINKGIIKVRVKVC